MIFVILLCVSLNFLFLGKSYEQDKVKLLKQVYVMVENAHDHDGLGGDDFKSDLDVITNANSILMGIVDKDYNTLYCSIENQTDISVFFITLQNEIVAGIDPDTIIEKADEYLLRYTYRTGLMYVELSGSFDDGCMYLMRLPISSINESVSFANKFFMLCGIIGAVVGSIIIYFFMTKLLKPLEELNRISNRMVDLDFTARYTESTHNEIDILGENMNKLSESLENSIAGLKQANMELEKDLEKIDSNDRMRQEFVASVSHDMKTPIAIIQGYAEGLKDGVAVDQENLDYYCDVIIDEAGKMNTMLKHFLNLNELEFGRNNIMIEHFDVTDMIKGYLSSAEMIAKQNGITVNFEGESEYVWADVAKAEMVLGNYFTNAVHYCMPNAGGEKIISIYLERIYSSIRIHVVNTGDPIEEDKIPRLWEKFFKVDEARTTKYGGNGLGLAIVKAIQDLIGMKYGVGNVNDGVDFWFDLDAEGSSSCKKENTNEHQF